MSQVIPPSRRGAATEAGPDRDESTAARRLGGGCHRRRRGRGRCRPARWKETPQRGSPESVEEAFHAAGGLLLQHLDAAFHLRRGGTGGREGDCWSHTNTLGSGEGWRGGRGSVLTSILDDFAKAPTGCT